MDGILIFAAELRKTIDGTANHIQQSTFNLFTYGYTDWSTQRFHGKAAAESVGTLHCYGTDNIFPDVLLYFKENLLSIGPLYI